MLRSGNRFRLQLVLLSALFVGAAGLSSMATDTGATAKLSVKDRAKDSVKVGAKDARGSVRTIIFPRQSLGALYLVQINEIGDTVFEPTLVGQARGLVTTTVPPNTWLQLRANGAVMNDPKILDTLPPDALQSFEISATPLDDTEDVLSDNTLRHLARLSGLRHITLKSFEPTDAGISSLTVLKHLKHLRIVVGKLKGACFKDVSTMPELTDLVMSINSLKNENIAALVHCPKLKRLIFHRCQIDPQGVKYVSQCPYITDLSLSLNPLVNDASMKDIARMKQLQILDVAYTAVTIKGLRELAGLTKISNLKVAGKDFPLSQRGEIKKLFPHAAILYEENSKTVDRVTSKLFAPLPK